MIATQLLLLAAVVGQGPSVIHQTTTGWCSPIITNVTGVASATTAAGLLTLSSAQVLQAGMLGVLQSIGTATALDGTIATVISTNLSQTSFKANGWNAVAQGATADTGYFAVLVTGSQANPTGELPAGQYPAGVTAGQFVLMIEGPKLRC